MDGSDKKTYAVIYARVSTVKQTKRGDGLNSQVTRCREFAKYRGYDIAEIFKDDKSGKLMERPGMMDMLSYIRRNRSKSFVVIIDDISRLARGIEAHLALRAAIDATGARLESPSVEFGTDPDSILVENMLASVSQHQRQKNGQQMVNRKQGRLLNGYWPFFKPVGYKFEFRTGQGNVLVRDEPVASIVQEGLEAFASGRLTTRAEVKRFFESHPVFPRDGQGKIRAQQVGEILTRPLYAGYVESKFWGISLRKGQHEGLISFEMYESIQERLTGKVRTPNRKDLHEDFPLRGAVLCGCCQKPYTASWTKGRHGGRYAYYHCVTRGCDDYGKCVKRDLMQSQFESLIRSLTPDAAVLQVARKMFRTWWDHQATSSAAQAQSLKNQSAKITQQVQKLLERVTATDSDTLVKAYEDGIHKLERQRIVIDERIANCGRPLKPYAEALQTAEAFLSNPCNLWVSDRFEHKRAVLKLAFASPLVYVRNQGFQTPDMALPFKVLARPNGAEIKLAGVRDPNSTVSS